MTGRSFISNQGRHRDWRNGSTRVFCPCWRKVKYVNAQLHLSHLHNNSRNFLVGLCIVSILHYFWNYDCCLYPTFKDTIKTMILDTVYVRLMSDCSDTINMVNSINKSEPLDIMSPLLPSPGAWMPIICRTLPSQDLVHYLINTLQARLESVNRRKLHITFFLDR